MPVKIQKKWGRLQKNSEFGNEKVFSHYLRFGYVTRGRVQSLTFRQNFEKYGVLTKNMGYLN